MTRLRSKRWPSYDASFVLHWEHIELSHFFIFVVETHFICNLFSVLIFCLCFQPCQLQKTLMGTKKDFNGVLQAIKSCIVEGNSIRKSAREHGINDTTLTRYVRQMRANFEDVLTERCGFVGIYSCSWYKNSIKHGFLSCSRERSR